MSRRSDRTTVLVVPGADASVPDRLVDRLAAVEAVDAVDVARGEADARRRLTREDPPACVVANAADPNAVVEVARTRGAGGRPPIVALAPGDRTEAAFEAGAADVHVPGSGADVLAARVGRLLDGTDGSGAAGGGEGTTERRERAGESWSRGDPDTERAGRAEQTERTDGTERSERAEPGSGGPPLRSRERQLEAVYEFAAGLPDCETPEEVCWRTVEAADRNLPFAASSVCLVEDDRVVPTASTDETGPLALDAVPADEGPVGEALDTGRAVVHERTPLVPEGDFSANGSTEQSGLTVPVGEWAVFQAVVDAEDAGDHESDREIAELLVSHAREALRRVRFEAELGEERDRIVALFENLPEPVAACHADGGRPIVDDVNAAFERVFGYDEAEIVGEDIDDYVLPDGETGISLDDTYYVGDTMQSEVRRRTETGERDFLVTVIPAELGDFSTEGFVVYTDITGRKRRESELRRQNERLEEFTSLVSHDLRNPLNVATGHLDLAREAHPDDDPDHIETAADALDRMEGLIVDFLSLARQGRTVDETETVDLGDTVRRAWATVDTASEASLVVDDGLGTVPADGERLRTVFENLFRNSMEHGSTSSRSPPDDRAERGGSVCVTVGPLPEKVGPGFYVADDGPGIPEDERDEVFEYGYSTDPDGTGFGLATVRRVIEAHGWSIAVGGDDAPGPGGATFVIHTD
jgi:PAS domain S-box-containing protein